MKKDLENRLQQFNLEVEKFTARWNHLKPSGIDADTKTELIRDAAKNLRERRQELDDVIKNKGKLVYVNNYMFLLKIKYSIIQTILLQDVFGVPNLNLFYEMYQILLLYFTEMIALLLV